MPKKLFCDNFECYYVKIINNINSKQTKGLHSTIFKR